MAKLKKWRYIVIFFVMFLAQVGAYVSVYFLMNKNFDEDSIFKVIIGAITGGVIGGILLVLGALYKDKKQEKSALNNNFMDNSGE